eukprot:6554000-Karenia_brevis.AAC.1
MRKIVAPARNGSRSIDDLLRKFPHVLAPAIEQLIAHDPYVCRACDNDVLTEAIAQAQTTTWLAVEGTSEVSHTFRGTQPGRQLADLIVNMSFAPIIHEVVQAIDKS